VQKSAKSAIKKSRKPFSHCLPRCRLFTTAHDGIRDDTSERNMRRKRTFATESCEAFRYKPRMIKVSFIVQSCFRFVIDTCKTLFGLNCDFFSLMEMIQAGPFIYPPSSSRTGRWAVSPVVREGCVRRHHTQGCARSYRTRGCVRSNRTQGVYGLIVHGGCVRSDRTQGVYGY
jgi:hypothetical protein